MEDQDRATFDKFIRYGRIPLLLQYTCYQYAQTGKMFSLHLRNCTYSSTSVLLYTTGRGSSGKGEDTIQA